MDIIDNIRNGMHDDELDTIVEAVRRRRKRMGQETYDLLEVGDSVCIRMDAPIKPKYILGATGEVTEKRVSRIAVRFDSAIHDPYGKWAGKTGIMQPEWLKAIDPQDRVGDLPSTTVAGATVTELPIRP